MNSTPITSTPQFVTQTVDAEHRFKIQRQLRDLGVHWYGLKSMEAHYLPRIIHPQEKIGGVVYGRHKDSFAMLVATDRRIIFLDVKPLFTKEKEITYDVVSGISYGHAAFWTTVTLHSKVGDYAIRTHNRYCAEGFIAHIEHSCLEHRIGGVS